jgi:hypothetical protein
LVFFVDTEITRDCTIQSDLPTTNFCSPAPPSNRIDSRARPLRTTTGAPSEPGSSAR